MSTCVVYGLSSSADGEVRYVGQTKLSLARRRDQHLYQARAGHRNHRATWMRRVLANGDEVQIIPLVTDAVWNETEIQVIATLRAAGARLVNATSGGDGVRDPSPEVRAKIVAALTGRKATSDQRRAMSERMKAAGIPPEQKAKMAAGVQRAYAERGPEISAKLSAAHMGHEVSVATREKIGAAHLGSKRSDDVRAKMAAKQKAYFANPEAREKTSAATRAAMQRPEVRAKVAEASQGLWATPGHREKMSAALKLVAKRPGHIAKMARARAKLTDEQVIEARRLHKAGVRAVDLCRMFGLTSCPMSLLLRGKTFRHLPL